MKKKRTKSFPKHSKKVLIPGTLFVHARKGFGFVSPDHPEDFPFDIFVPARDLKGAIDGDHVVVHLFSEVREGKRKGVIHQVLSRGRSSLVGTITQISKKDISVHVRSLGEGGYLKAAKSNKQSYQIGDRVLLKTPPWKEQAQDNLPPLKITGFIGHISDAVADFPAIKAEFSIQETFPRAALEQASNFSQEHITQALRSRKDLRDLLCFTIDSATAKDFDDAISLTYDHEDNYILGVHIADVSHYVTPNSPLDYEAAKRCNSIYFPGKVIPMLPSALSDNLCSLKPNVDRLAVSVFMTFTKSGHLSDYQIARSVIRSKYRLTYDEVDLIIAKEQPHPVSNTLQEMAVLCRKFAAIREARGCIQLFLPSFTMSLDEQEEPIALIKTYQTFSHQLIEEFMLKANEVIAYHISHQGVDLPFRVHESPNDESLLLFEETAKSMGFEVRRTPTQEPDYQYLLDKQSDGHPLRSILHSHFVRSMKTASYSTTNVGHYGLQLDYYTHFTSPIRRYVDLIVHRLLFHPMSISHTHLEHIVKACSNQERVAAKAESAFDNLKKLRFLSKFLSEQPDTGYSAFLILATPEGISFTVSEFCQEGFIPAAQLPLKYSWKKSYQSSSLPKKLSPGAPITVKLVSIDLISQEIVWAIVEKVSKKSSKVKKDVSKTGKKEKKVSKKKVDA